MPKRISIVMGLPFSSLNESMEEEILERVSELSGSIVDDWSEITYRPGCIFFNATAESEKVDLLVDLFVAYVTSPEDLPKEQLELIEQFVTKFKVKLIREAADLSPRRSKPKSSLTTVVFIHGLGGDENSFGKFPDFLGDVTGLPTQTYRYRSYKFLRTSPTLTHVRASFEGYLNRIVRETNGSLAFVAHSMGGLIVRDLLSSQAYRRDPLDEVTKHVAFFASPQRGAVLAEVFKRIPGISKNQIIDLAPGSRYQMDLIPRWNGWLSQSIVPIDNIRSIVAGDDAIVGAATTFGEDPEPVLLAGKTHKSIVKPESKSDEAVQTLAGMYRDAGIIAKL